MKGDVKCSLLWSEFLHFFVRGPMNRPVLTPVLTVGLQGGRGTGGGSAGDVGMKVGDGDVEPEGPVWWVHFPSVI